MKNITKLLLVVSLFASLAFAEGVNNNTKACGDMNNGTCRVVTKEEKPVIEKDEKDEDSKNIVLKWIDIFLEELFN